MTEPVIVKDSLVDAWANESNNKARKNTARLHMRSGAGNQRHTLIYPARAWPNDVSQMIESFLGFKNGEDWAGTVTVTVRLLATKWNLNKLSFNNIPAVHGPTVTMQKTGAAKNTLWEIDVTSLIQYAIDTGKWYGFRLTVNSTTTKWIHSSEARREALRPYLSLVWSEAPEAPDELNPGGGDHVSTQYPPFHYNHNDVLGSTEITMQEIQIFPSTADPEVDIPEFTTGQIATSEPAWTSAGSAWGGIANAATKQWRVRSKDDSQWSDWSDPEPFSRTNKSTLTISSPSGSTISSPTPTITWNVSGVAYKVAVALASDPNAWIFDSGKIPGADTSYTIPFGVITDPDETYIVTVYVWDAVQRANLPGDPMYIWKKTGNLTVAFSGAVTNITGLALSYDPVFPVATLDFNHAGGAEEFILLRSLDEGLTWEYAAEYLDTDVLVSGTAYRIQDRLAPSYKEVYWRVVPVVGGVQGTGQTISGQMRRKAPMLFTPDGEDPCVFLNPRRERSNNDLQEVHFTLDGEAAVVTQYLGRKMGKIEGVFTADGLPGTSADEMLKSFRAHRKRKGQPVIVATGNESFLAVPFNFDDDIIIDNEGIYYYAVFEWVEVPPEKEIS